LVEAEQVGRIVATLDRHQLLPSHPWVGSANPRRALIAEEADVRTALAPAQGRREVVDPRLVSRCLIGTLVHRGNVYHDACPAVGERSGAGAHARQSCRQAPERSLRIGDLAEVAGVDPAHLARAFRAHYGTTAGAYLREIRVRRATDALARSSAALSQIALDSGFADQSHFTRVFSAIYGLTPARWRALRKK